MSVFDDELQEKFSITEKQQNRKVGDKNIYISFQRMNEKFFVKQVKRRASMA